MAGAGRGCEMPGCREAGEFRAPGVYAPGFDGPGLPLDADQRALRERYSELVRRYHPDRNGGDRSYETRLQSVVEAYQVLRRAAACA